MDRRSQRLVILFLLLGIVFLLFKDSHGHNETALQQIDGGLPNAGAKLNLKGLVPANATLGVCTNGVLTRTSHG